MIKTKEQSKLKASAAVFWVCYLAYVAVYLARLNLSAASAALESLGVADKSQIGILGSIFFICFSVGRLVNGYLGDRIEAKYFMVTGLGVIGVSNILIGCTMQPEVMMVLWGVNALGQSSLWGAILRIMVNTYGEEKAAKKTIFLLSATATGSILGLLVGAQSVKWFGVRFAFYIPGLIALVSGLLVLVTAKETVTQQRDKKGAFHLLQEKEIFLALVPSILHGVIKDNLTLWVTLYFVDKFNLGLNTAAIVSFAVPIMGLLGRFSYNPIYNKTGKNENKAALAAFGVIAACAFLLGTTNPAVAVAAVLLSVISAAVMVVNTSYLSIFCIRYAEKNAVSVVSGIVDFFVYMGAGIGSAVFGYMIKTGGYELMFAVWAVVALAGAVFLWMLEKRKHK